MRAKSILMLASVAMILIAIGIGNASAATGYYQNEVKSELYISGGNPAARVTSSDSDVTPNIRVNDNLYNYNRFANYGSSAWGLANVWWSGSSYDSDWNTVIPLTGDFHQYNLAVGQTAGSGEFSNAVVAGTSPDTYGYDQAATYYVSTYPWNRYAYSTNPGSYKNFNVVP
jgi:hypothetical protein